MFDRRTPRHMTGHMRCRSLSYRSHVSIELAVCMQAYRALTDDYGRMLGGNHSKVSRRY